MKDNTIERHGYSCNRAAGPANRSTSQQQKHKNAQSAAIRDAAKKPFRCGQIQADERVWLRGDRRFSHGGFDSSRGDGQDGT